MPVLRNIAKLYTGQAGPAGDLQAIPDAAIRWEDNRVAWLGAETDLPHNPTDEVIDGRRGLLVPGLIDCHTHLAFGGWRADEFDARIRGVSYQEIARRGGGILNTMRATRQASRDELRERCLRHLEGMVALGVTAVEAKSGYGLNVESELKLLEVYQEVNSRQPVAVIPTLLAAHVVPPEFTHRRSDYVRLICGELIPEVASRGLARFCDVFVEEGAFTLEEARQILECGISRGLKPKLHADQLSAGGGAELAAELGATSADHLEQVSDSGLRRLAEAGVVGVLLPLAALYLAQMPAPARRLIEAGVRVAVATDFNPGSAPSYSLPLAMLLACTVNRMTPEEALLGVTRNAAAALGETDRRGVLVAGLQADFALLETESLPQWISHFGGTPAPRVWIGGREVRKDREPRHAC